MVMPIEILTHRPEPLLPPVWAGKPELGITFHVGRRDVTVVSVTPGYRERGALYQRIVVWYAVRGLYRYEVAKRAGMGERQIQAIVSGKVGRAFTQPVFDVLARYGLATEERGLRARRKSSGAGVASSLFAGEIVVETLRAAVERAGLVDAHHPLVADLRLLEAAWSDEP